MPDLVLASVSCSRDSSHSLPLICCDPQLLVYKSKKKTKDLPENANTPSRRHSSNMYLSTLPKSKARLNETHGLVRVEFEDNYQIRTRTCSLHLQLLMIRSLLPAWIFVGQNARMEQQHRQAGNKFSNFSKFSKFSEAQQTVGERPQMSPRNSVEISHGPRAFRQVFEIVFHNNTQLWLITFHLAGNFKKFLPFMHPMRDMVGNFGTNVGVRLQVQNMPYCMMSLEKIWVGQMGRRLEEKIAAVLLLHCLDSFPLALFNVFGGFALASCFHENNPTFLSILSFPNGRKEFQKWREI